MRIYITEQELASKELGAVCLRMEQMRNRILVLKDYYLGRQAILRKPQRSNNVSAKSSGV